MYSICKLPSESAELRILHGPESPTGHVSQTAEAPSRWREIPIVPVFTFHGPTRPVTGDLGARSECRVYECVQPLRTQGLRNLDRPTDMQSRRHCTRRVICLGPGNSSPIGKWLGTRASEPVWGSAKLSIVHKGAADR